MDEHNQIINEMEALYKEIKQYRVEIAEMRMKLNIKKDLLWATAEGTVDQKKDYIKSQTADLRRDIEVAEAEIELAYNQIEILTWRV